MTMKKIAVAAAVVMLLSGCGQPEFIDGKEYPTYGFFNQDTQKSEKVCYEPSIGNIIWSILLFETLVAPIYFIGFSLFNPVRAKGKDGSCGIDAK